jgi:hypothetical protein
MRSIRLESENPRLTRTQSGHKNPDQPWFGVRPGRLLGTNITPILVRIKQKDRPLPAPTLGLALEFLGSGIVG